MYILLYTAELIFFLSVRSHMHTHISGSRVGGRGVGGERENLKRASHLLRRAQCCAPFQDPKIMTLAKN